MACCSSITVFKPCIACSPCFCFEHGVWIIGGYSSSFSHGFSSHSQRNKCCFRACFLSHTMLCLHHLRAKRKGKGQNNRLFGLQKVSCRPCLRPTLPQRYAFSLCFELFIYLLTKGHEHWPIPLKRRETTNEGQPQGVVCG